MKMSQLIEYKYLEQVKTKQVKTKQKMKMIQFAVRITIVEH